jgi:large conductance mechanosensitive channel
MLSGFRAFLARGNVIDLAVAVVIGAAFGAVVTALVKDLITPLLAALFGKPEFGTLAFSINHSRFAYGDFLNAVVSFVLVAAAIYFVIVAPMEHLAARRRAREPLAPPTTRPCPECLEEIPLAATRCRACTTQVGSVA